MIRCSRGDESAVSPVIGVMLILAITIVLIGITAVVVMGAAHAGPAKVAGVLAEQNGLDLRVTISGGHDVSDVQELRIAGDNAYTILNKSQGNFSIGVPADVKGAMMFLSDPGFLTITGTFSDGTEQVLWQKKMTPAATLTQDYTHGNLILKIYDTGLFSNGNLTAYVGSKNASVEIVKEITKPYSFKFLQLSSGTQHVTIVRNPDSENVRIFDGMMTF